MRPTRILALILAGLFCLGALVPVFSNLVFTLTSEVHTDEGDYFLYGVCVLSALVFAALLAYVIVRRRK